MASSTILLTLSHGNAFALPCQCALFLQCELDEQREVVGAEFG